MMELWAFRLLFWISIIPISLKSSGRLQEIPELLHLRKSLCCWAIDLIRRTGEDVQYFVAKGATLEFSSAANHRSRFISNPKVWFQLRQNLKRNNLKFKKLKIKTLSETRRNLRGKGSAEVSGISGRKNIRKIQQVKTKTLYETQRNLRRKGSAEISGISGRKNIRKIQQVKTDTHCETLRKSAESAGEKNTFL